MARRSATESAAILDVLAPFAHAHAHGNERLQLSQHEVTYKLHEQPRA